MWRWRIWGTTSPSTANNSFNEIDQSSNADDSFNTDVGIDVGISDSLNEILRTARSDGMIAVEGSTFDAISAIKDALKGDGMNLAFSSNQISEIMDNDTLHHPTLNSQQRMGPARARQWRRGDRYLNAKDGFGVDSAEDMAFQAVGDADAMVGPGGLQPLHRDGQQTSSSTLWMPRSWAAIPR